MRTTLSAGQLATIALSLAPLTSALAWPRWLPEIDALVVRQDDSSSSNSPSDDASQPTSTGRVPPPVTTTNLNNGGITPTGKSGNSTSTAEPTHTQFPAQDPAGNVVMITPAATAQTTNLYKIGDTITWGWNYTHLQGTPTAIDVLVSVATLSATYTLTQNMTFETPAVFKWDTQKYNAEHVGNNLPTEQYTLIIYDADGSPSSTAEAGYLAPFSGFKFGLYEPRPREDLADWKCATCTSSLASKDRSAIGVAAGMSLVTVLSFTWFVVGFADLV